MLGRIVQDCLQNLDEDVGSGKVEAAQIWFLWFANYVAEKVTVNDVMHNILSL